MYLTRGDILFISGLIHYLRLYIKGFHIHQLSKNKKPPVRQLQQRFNLNYRPLSRLNRDLKVMPESHRGHKLILYIIDKINYLITLPINQSRSEEIGDALLENVISKYCIPDYIKWIKIVHIYVVINELPI